jgi:hypothetical protein
MSKPMLQTPRVVAVIGEFESAGVTQQVRMNWERHSCLLPEPLDEFIKADCRSRDNHAPKRTMRCYVGVLRTAVSAIDNLA